MFHLEIDDREPDEIFSHFDKEGGTRKITVVKKRLSCMDYAVYYGGNPLFGIERKTWNDLAQSIKDGRIDEQIKRMQASKLKTFLLMEGTLHASHCNIEAKNLLTKVDHIILRGDVTGVLYSSSLLGTTKRIIQLIDHYPLDLSNLVVKKERDNILDTLGGSSDEKIVVDMFAAIKGVAYNTARLFMDNGWSIMDLYESEPNILGEMIYPLSGSMLGTVKATHISEDMDTKKCWIRILTAINGVTAKTAALILDKYPLVYDWTPTTLSKISKGDKSLGLKVATKIITLLNWKKPPLLLK